MLIVVDDAHWYGRLCYRRYAEELLAVCNKMILKYSTGVKKHVMGYPTPPPPPLSPSELETYVAPALRTLQQVRLAIA